MLKRKILKNLIEWKNNPRKRCLLVKGARQVGKTFIIDLFAKENYENYIYLNFVEHPEYKDIFEGSLDAETFIKQTSLYIKDLQFKPNRTIVFLDEIQDCPRARAALKFLTIDKRFDVIASGSMLGINYKNVPSYPVGYVDHLDMYSLDFEEFLWSNGISEKSIKSIKEYFDKKQLVPKATHDRMMELFKEYIVVGGMPMIVDEFINTHNFGNILTLQKGIIDDYLDDIAKYADVPEKTKAKACFLSIPKHLSKDYKKFRYSIVEKNSSARKYGGSLMWLFDAGIINFCYRLSGLELPLEGNAKSDEFKVYMRDTGLLMAMLEDDVQKEIINGDLGIYKGAIYENIIADIFSKLNKKLYYFEKGGHIEIDFFIRYNRKLTAIEVKSATNTKSKSLNSIIENYGVKQGIKLSAKNLGKTENILSLPLYMAMFL
ncbi:MAG: AAA family ATPase [Firmicutes bacterium]|nr:AAA family ATPase [Bacillota bacterium]